MIALALSLGLTNLSFAETKNLDPQKDWSASVLQIKKRLVTDGIDESILSRAKLEGIEFDRNAIESKMLDALKPSGQSFETYSYPRYIKKVRKFLRDPVHQKAFEKATFETGVPSSIVASILWVETLYRAYPPRFKALSVLLSLAALGDSDFLGVVLPGIELKAKEYSGHEKMNWPERANKIGTNWYDQLKAFLEISKKLKWNPRLIRSSWAGAMGVGQFMPQTALRNMMRDGKFESSNLWSWNDTIVLVARHVQENGWHTMASDAQKREAIRLYNGREAYANAVLEVADLAKKL